MNSSTVIRVNGESPYDVVIGRALISEVATGLGTTVAKVLIVHPVALTASAELLRESLIAEGYEPILAGVPDSEDAKRVEVAAFCWTIMGQADFTRSDAVIGFGGGSTTDLAGFVAATWLRGVKLVQVIHVIDEHSITGAVEISAHVDAILLDSGNPNLATKELGGTGRVHNWDISKSIKESIDIPVFLAGGINKDNVRAAIDHVQPFGVDLCSSVRTNGKLDEWKLDEFFNAVYR